MWPALRVLTLSLTTLACNGGNSPAPGPTDDGDPTCPRPAQAVVPGDANGDGHADVADAVVIMRHLADGGPAPACLDAVDLVPDQRLELDDAFSLLVGTYEGGFSLPDLDDACDDATPLTPPACDRLVAAIDAPATAVDSGFDARVTLDPGEQSIQAWSLSVEAEGCDIVAATTAGTAAASVTSDPPGLRDLGYDATFVVDDGAVSTAILGFMQGRALPPGPQPVLSVQVRTRDCEPCTLRLGDALTALGEPVENLAVASGAAWPLPAAQVQVAGCP